MKVAFEKIDPAMPSKWLAVRPRAFSRIDLLAIIFIVLFFGLWLGTTHLGERGRIARCQANLAALGKATQAYANDEWDSIPAADINVGKLQVAWDLKLLPYLKLGLVKANSEQLFELAPRYFACPSDQVPHKGTPRSYAMSGNDMLPEHWPPRADIATGVGLVWETSSVSRLLGMAALKSPDALPGIKVSVIPAPSDTFLLTDLINPINTFGGRPGSAVYDPSAQQKCLQADGAAFHDGRLNYLMVDGHVELLSPLQTGTLKGAAGIWSIGKAD
jgi:prepilin-type processing-associated H-X9-DG protein